ncbi:hypothetical protein P152DRAFT_208277 [Eremomyces bilateralis CBS 781.70]|uniref:Uncharacterized protein n=1 Tax=Eremomyces bilateralis CBS 781.70 TaxID=1392243 RepID=A0A6G1FSC0_9PEZI|nr:uncharacterized protein P152DRAFT_208277 [Eremomyces bilateralis CBS 781.70]KAF1808755.1 hypothetical protein P152DRAFT_208277 [Eremomyces bilateralis CBS 781.70]
MPSRMKASAAIFEARSVSRLSLILVSLCGVPNTGIFLGGILAKVRDDRISAGSIICNEKNAPKDLLGSPIR